MKRQITDSIGENLTDSDLECINASEFKYSGRHFASVSESIKCNYSNRDWKFIHFLRPSVLITNVIILFVLWRKKASNKTHPSFQIVKWKW